MKKNINLLFVIIIVVFFISCTKKKYSCTCNAQVRHVSYDVGPQGSIEHYYNYSTSQIIDEKMTQKKGTESCDYIKRAFLGSLPSAVGIDQTVSSECHIE